MGVDPAMQHYKGIIYTFDLNDPEARPKPITYENFDDSQFVPHGIDIYIDPKTQEVSLFVVNHAAGKHSIEIFQFDQENVMLKHRKTITDEKISSPNDVVAAGKAQYLWPVDEILQGYTWILTGFTKGPGWWPNIIDSRCAKLGNN